MPGVVIKTLNVAYGLRFKSGMAKADRDRRVREILKTVHESFGITTLYVTHD